MAAKKRRKKYTGPGSETAVQKAILAWLATTPILHWRQNSGMAILGGRSIILGEPGLPDILCVLDGLLVGLEVKGLNAAGKMGVLSKSQRAMRTKFSRAGAEYFMVTSLDQAQQAIAFFVGNYTLKKAGKE